MKHTKKFAATAMAAALVLPGTAAFASGGGDDMKHRVRTSRSKQKPLTSVRHSISYSRSTLC
ncbi:hypothetical protein [Exiguobacterium antarcticum]|uniref:hypothetical protein n=1 Tax=Exiguobacterium antarcticum TaxID=132920 RepID=UPI0003081437|nr:hypothetical protein [Exiguobacterium antarcticum]